MSLLWRTHHASFRSLPPLSLDRRLRPPVLAARPGDQQRNGAELSAENAYRITIAVAGFSEADLSIESKENALTVKGEKQANDNGEKREVLHQGIAARAFERRFQLADYVQVTGASLENGLLHIDLVREIPEAKKPRQIPIGAGSAKVLEAKVETAKAA